VEQELENMENEIVQLKAQLEGDSDIEETKMSDEQNVAGDDASMTELSSLPQQSVSHSEQKTGLLQEHLHGALNSEIDWPLKHEGDRSVSQVHVEIISKPFCTASDVQSTQDDVAHFTSVLTPSETIVCDESAELLVQQGVVPDAVKKVLTRSETEDWSDLSANTLKMLCEPMTLSNDTTVRQSLSKNTLGMEQDGGRSTNANFDSEERSADMSVCADIERVSSLVEDGACSTSAALTDVYGAELAVSRSHIQLENTCGFDQDVPDSVDGMSAACDVADNGEDDSGSCVSCEDIVIPDSEDDLFSSPHNGDIHHAMLTSRPDESEYVKVSEVCSDICDEFDEVCGSTQPVNMSAVSHNSEMIHHAIVDSLAASQKKEECQSKEKSSIMNHIIVSQCNQTNNTCVSDKDSTDVMKHKFSVNSTDKTMDTAFELNQQLTTSSAISEQLSKRPHWTFVVSGISQALDQVIVHTTDVYIVFYFALVCEHIISYIRGAFKKFCNFHMKKNHKLSNIVSFCNIVSCNITAFFPRFC